MFHLHTTVWAGTRTSARVHIQALNHTSAPQRVKLRTQCCVFVYECSGWGVHIDSRKVWRGGLLSQCEEGNSDWPLRRLPIDPHSSCINWGIRLSSQRVKTHAAGDAPKRHWKASHNDSVIVVPSVSFSLQPPKLSASEAVRLRNFSDINRVNLWRQVTDKILLPA